MEKHRTPQATQIREAAGTAGASGARFEVVVIREGLGNFKDAFFYSKPALESLCKVAEGKKVYADHPNAMEDEIQPERSVLKAFGHYENFRMQEGDGGCAEVVADLVVCDGAAFDRERGLIQHAVKYSEKYKNQDFIGLSILASGDSEKIGIDDLIRQGVPQGCMEKLSQAKDQGVEQVRLAKRFDDCTSIDLVTEAGAGGRIQKMLESQKEKPGMAKKTNKENEATNPNAKDGGAAPHPDKDQDVALVKSMMDKYHGKDGKPGSDEEQEGLGKQLKAAHEAAKKMGLEGAEAEEAAVKHCQMAKHMQSTEAEESEEAKEKREAEEKAKKEAAEKAKKEAEEKATKEAEAEVAKGSKEAAAKIVSLTSENSALRERLAKIELDGHVDKTLRESKAPMSATKKFREAIGDVKSKEEFDRLFAVFQRTRESTLGGEAGGKDDFSEAYANPEREVSTPEHSGSECSFAEAVTD